MNPALDLASKSLLLVNALVLTACFSPALSPNGESGSSTGADGSSTVPDTSGPQPGTSTTNLPDETTSSTDPASSSATSTGIDDDNDDDTGSSSTGPGGDDTSSGGSSESTTSPDLPTCDNGGVCVPLVPEGWNGPVATRTIPIEDDIPPCGGDSYTELQVSDAFGGLVGDDFECGCECNPSNLSCEGTSTVAVGPVSHGLDPCASVPPFDFFFAVLFNQAHPADLSLIGGRAAQLVESPNSALDGSCTPEPSQSESAAAFGTRTIACGTFDAEPAGCDEGLCVPQPAAPYSSNVCVWAEGDLECPTGYDDRSVYHASFADTRDCSTCTCGTASGSCEDEVILFTGACDGGGCPVRPTFSLDELETCQNLFGEDFCPPGGCDGGVQASEITNIVHDGDVNATCPPSGGNPVGSVEGTDATTICCAG